jgi:hypothetical protein
LLGQLGESSTITGLLSLKKTGLVETGFLIDFELVTSLSPGKRS